MNIIVIGGDAAGMSAAARLRRGSPGDRVTVFEQSGETSYGACGLPYYISGLNEDADKLRIRKPDSFLAAGIDLRLGHQVLSVDATGKTVTARCVETGKTVTEPYDRLVVASPVRPAVSGGDREGVFTLKSIADGQAIRRWAMGPQVRSVVIVGAGYIGMELTEAFVQLGKGVTLIEAAPRPLPLLEDDISCLVTGVLEQAGVALRLEERVTALTGAQRVEGVVTDRGTYPADLVIFCVGVRPNTEFLAGTGVALLPNGAVLVDDQMKTSVPHIFAAGDCATIQNRITGQPVYLPLGTNANKQGKVLGEVLLGRESTLPGVLGTSMCRILDLEVARTGLNVAEGEAAGIPIRTVRTTAHTKPPYYPGGCQLTVKLFYHADSQVLLGAQLAGREGAASRIGLCALAIEANMTCAQLAMADLGYAPPFTYVWDPVQLAAGMAK